MLGWSAAFFGIAIIAASVALSGIATLPFDVAVVLSLGGFVTGVILIFMNHQPPET